MEPWADLLVEGDEALARGAWDDAGSAFRRALAAGAGPEALEGLASAAFFLDQVGEALDARERAYAAYRGAGRAVDAARVATALAWDYRALRGESAVSDGWLARARSLLRDAGPTREGGWLALREASFALPGDPERARERCAAAERLGRELGDVDVEMTAVALDGLVQVSRGDVAAGMARLDEATTAATAGEMRDPVAIGFSCCYLIFACERVRDVDRAGEWCERLSTIAEGWNIRALRAVCRTHYGTVLVLRGEWSDAEVELTEAAAVLAGAAGDVAGTLARLAELRRRQGREEEARELLLRAEHHPLAVLCGAQLALDHDDAETAMAGAQRFLRLVGPTGMERAPGLEVLVEAAGRLGRSEVAAGGVSELREIAEAAGTAPLRGAARHAQGHVALAAGAGEEACEAFEDAVGLYGRAGLPYEASRARIDLASALHSVGRRDAAQREIGQARDRFMALGASSEARRARMLLARRGASARDALSRREREVLGLVARGNTNAEIATTLVLSEHTVHRHVANILAKLDAPSRAAAVARATELGLI
jgi:LuxR family maltose regulon positive regulatory protein